MPEQTTFNAFSTTEFLAGLGLGFGALAVGALVVYVWRQWRDTAMPIVGLLLTVAAGIGLAVEREPPEDLWVGVVFLGVAGVLYPWARQVPTLPAVLALPGAWWVTRVVELPGAEWVPWVLFAWIVLGAPLVASFDRHFAEAGYGPILFVIAIGAMFTTLPDTEHILIVLGAALPLVLLAWPLPAASLSAVGIYPAMGVLAWVIAVDGQGRESSIVGAVACLGLLAVEPLVRWALGSTGLDRLSARWWGPLAAAAAQVVVVLAAARVAGLRDTAETAAVIAVLVGVVAAALLAASRRTGAPELVDSQRAAG